MVRSLLILMLLVVCGAAVSPAQNLTQTTPGHVMLLEPSYMPYRVQLIMDTGDSNCPAGGWIQWIGPNTDSNKAVYASLLAAMMSNRLVDLVYDQNTVHQNGSPCLISFVHIH